MDNTNIVVVLVNSTDDAKLIQLINNTIAQLKGDVGAAEYLFEIVKQKPDDFEALMHTITESYLPNIMFNFKQIFGVEIDEIKGNPAPDVNYRKQILRITDGEIRENYFFSLMKLEEKAKDIWYKYKYEFKLDETSKDI